MVLRPFFSFYGSKYRLVPYYPKPDYETIIEPFAGSAAYSVRYYQHKVLLIERDPIIFSIWQYLIKVSYDEIMNLPDLAPEQSVDDLAISQEAKWLIGFWCNPGSSQPKKRLGAWARQSECTGGIGWRTSGQLVWSNKVRIRIATQIEHIRHWKVIEGNYFDAPNLDATWFIDPPYSKAGKYYRYNQIDYTNLAEFAKNRRGNVIVCENEGANWLPFQKFKTTKGASNSKNGGKISSEVMWRLEK